MIARALFLPALSPPILLPALSLPTLRPALLLSLTLLLLPAAGPARADEARAEVTGEAERFLGSYAFAGGVREAQSLQSTVDALVDDFNPLLRGLARRRLQRSVRVPDRIEIATSDGGLQLTVIGAPDFPNDPRYEHGALVLRQSNFEGTRETHFRLSPDGRRLVMRVATRSALLPDHLEYELTFERPGRILAGPAPALDAGS